MEDDIIELLKQVPEMKKVAETFKETSEADRQTLRESLKTLVDEIHKRPAAYIPETEINKIRVAISNSVARAPDMSGQVDRIANDIARRAASILANDTEIKVGVEHTHTHTHHHWNRLGQFASNETNEKWMKGLAWTIFILLTALVIIHLRWFGVIK